MFEFDERRFRTDLEKEIPIQENYFSIQKIRCMLNDQGAKMSFTILAKVEKIMEEHNYQKAEGDGYILQDNN